jgi:hypothetical protein
MLNRDEASRICKSNAYPELTYDKGLQRSPYNLLISLVGAQGLEPWTR